MGSGSSFTAQREFLIGTLLLLLVEENKARTPPKTNVSVVFKDLDKLPLGLGEGGNGEGINNTEGKDMEFGVCTVTCGIGIREVKLTSGCPGKESKCIIKVEECRGPIDCGWGIPISESLSTVKLACVYVPPENRFRFIWKMLIPDQQALLLPNDSAVLEVDREIHPMAFQCDTSENNNIIASVKYTVYSKDESQTRRVSRPDTDIILVFVLITGVIVCIGVIFALVFIIIHWGSVKTFWATKGNLSEPYSEESSVRFKDAASTEPLPTDTAGAEEECVTEWNE